MSKINFINSYSFIFSPRPGTIAGNLETIDKRIAEERLKIIQDKLFKNQIKRNESLEGKTVDILVENQMKDKIKLFGRTEYMTSVIFNGDVKNIGKVVQVKISNSNQTSLFGTIIEKQTKKVA